jgi:cell division topological specificity factor
MMSFFDKLFQRNSAGAAKNRLKVVLIHDRAEIPPGVLDEIKNDIVAVISRRLNIDAPHVAVNVDDESGERRLLVDIPILGGTTTRRAKPQP